MNENEKLSRGVTDQSLADMNLARKLGLLPLSPGMIEKDSLVADAIRAICAAGKARDAQIIFGGGTSLSQAQQVIQRMSEDADDGV
jgi:hypothetical protein